MARKRILDKAAVVRAAADLADQLGFEQLTLAVLAERLDVKVPSLYNHVDGLAGLRRDLAVLSVGELLDKIRRAAVGRAGDEAVIALANAYRRFAREHPGLYAAGVRAPGPDETTLLSISNELIGLLLDVLRAYGLVGDDAIHAVRGLRSVIHGFVSIETAGGFGMPLDRDESFDRLIRIFIGGLPA